MVFREGEESRIKMVFVVLNTCGVDIFHFPCQIIIPRNWDKHKTYLYKSSQQFRKKLSLLYISHWPLDKPSQV